MALRGCGRRQGEVGDSTRDRLEDEVRCGTSEDLGLKGLGAIQTPYGLFVAITSILAPLARLGLISRGGPTVGTVGRLGSIGTTGAACTSV